MIPQYEVLMTFGMKNDIYKHSGSFGQHFRALGALDAFDSYNGVGTELGREGGTFCVLSRVASQLKRVN